MLPTVEQRLIVKTTFRKLIPISEQTVTAFYNRLFELDPAARALFKGNMKDQVRKFIQMLAVLVSSLERIEEVSPAIQSMGKRHVLYGATKEQYTTVGVALLWSIETALGAEFTTDVKEAWESVYQMLADIAITGAYTT